MDWLFSGITDWLQESLIDAIIAILAGIFDDINFQINDIAVQVGSTPEDWNSGVFNMVRTLSETVVLPIAGIILTFILCYELIQLIIEKNNTVDDVFCNGGISNAHKSNRKQWSTHLWQMTGTVLKGG